MITVRTHTQGGRDREKERGVDGWVGRGERRMNM